GVVSVADPGKITLENSWHGAGQFYILVQASDGRSSSSLGFRIDLDHAPTTPADSDAARNIAPEGAPAGTVTGLTVSSTDPDGSPVTYSLIGDTSEGGFQIDAHTGVVSIADTSKITLENSFRDSGAFYIRVQASDGISSSGENFRIDLDH